MTYLGIDLGTSGIRLLLVDEACAPIGSVEHSYPLARLHSGWSEQHPADWLQALDAAIAELRATYPAFADLKGIGVAGHMHGATLLDAKGDVLRPCILWNDTRAHQQAAQLDNIPAVRVISGNIVFAGFTAPKLLWVRDNEPEIFQLIAKVLLPTAYLNYALTGDYVADMSDSAGTAWLDVSQRNWSAELLQYSAMDVRQMPRLVEGSAPAGTLQPSLMQKWGLLGTVTVAGGAGDNAAAACGIGALQDGQGFVSLGTSGVVLAARNSCAPAPETAVHTFCHALPNRWYQMGVTLSATDSLNWLGRITGAAPIQLLEAIGSTCIAPNPVRFLPYLAGERTPHNDAEIRGSFTNLSSTTTREDLTRAVLEGVAFSLCDAYQSLKAAGVSCDSLTAIGGGSASQLWLQILATVVGLPLKRPINSEFGAALGAARLGYVATTNAQPEEWMIAPEIGETIDPITALQDQYAEAYRAYKASYPVTGDLL